MLIIFIDMLMHMHMHMHMNPCPRTTYYSLLTTHHSLRTTHYALQVTLLDMNPSATRAAAAAAAAAATAAAAAAAAAPAAAEGQTSPRAAKTSVVRGYVEMAPGLARPQQPPASSPLAEVRVRELGLGLGLGLGLDSMLTQTLTLTPMVRAIFHAGRRHAAQRQARGDAAAPAAAAEGG